MSFKFEFKRELFQKQSTQFADKIRKAMQSSSLGNAIKDTFINDLKFQVRKGLSLSTNQKLKPLSASWIKMRKRIIADNGSPTYVSARKSNLSLSGKLLDSLKGNKKTTHEGLKIEYIFTGNHDAYKSKPLLSWRVKNSFGTGKTRTFNRIKKVPKEIQIGKTISNERLYTYVTRDRPFLGVRPETQLRLKKLVVEEVRRIVESKVT